MIYYNILVFLFLGSFIRKNKLIKKLTFIGMVIFLCLSQNIGSDIGSYRNMYNIYNFQNYKTFLYEKGFLFYMLAMKKVFVFNSFYMISKIFSILCFYKLIKKLKIKNYFLYFLFYVQLGIYLFLDCPLRNLMAISMVLLGIFFFFEKRILLFYILGITAISFHKSAIIFFIVPILLGKQNLKFFLKLKRTYLIILILILFFILNYNNIMHILTWTASYIPVLQTRLLKYSYNMEKFRGTGVNIQLIEKSMTVFLGIWIKDKIIKRNKYGKEVLILSILFLILYRISNSINILFRLQLFFRIFYLTLIIYIYKSLNSGILRIGYKILYFIYSVASVYFIVQSTYFIPYKNFLFNLL